MSRWISSFVIKPLRQHCTQEDTRRPTTEQNMTYSQESATMSQSSLFEKDNLQRVKSAPNLNMFVSLS